MERIAINRNRFFFWAVIVAILNPVFSGLILGLLMLAEPNLKKEGWIVTLFSVVWGLIAMMLVTKFKHLLPV